METEHGGTADVGLSALMPVSSSTVMMAGAAVVARCCSVHPVSTLSTHHHIISYHIISYIISYIISHHIISHHIIDLKRQNRLKVGTNKPKLICTSDVT